MKQKPTEEYNFYIPISIHNHYFNSVKETEEFKKLEELLIFVQKYDYQNIRAKGSFEEILQVHERMAKEMEANNLNPMVLNYLCEEPYDGIYLKHNAYFPQLSVLAFQHFKNVTFRQYEFTYHRLQKEVDEKAKYLKDCQDKKFVAKEIKNVEKKLKTFLENHKETTEKYNQVNEAIRYYESLIKKDDCVLTR